MLNSIEFTKDAEDDLDFWGDNEKILVKIDGLITATLQDPYRGIGKPEALKNDLKGCWSRRIDRKNRFVYKVAGDTLVIISLRYHYSKSKT